MNNKHLISQVKYHKSHTFSNNLFYKIYGSIVKRILKILTKANKKIILKKTLFYGRKMIIQLPEKVSVNIWNNSYHEPELTLAMLKFLKNGMTFYDVGAHYGYFSLLASKLVGQSGKVFAFEPTPTTFKILKKNLSFLPNTQSHRYVIFDDNKTVYLNDYGAEWSAYNTCSTPRHPALVDKESKKILTKAISIDNFSSKSRKPDFIKIDAESAEFQIISGMKETLSTKRPIISMEVGDEVKSKYSSINKINEILKYSYKVYELKDNCFKEHILKVHYSYTNLIFLPI